VKPLPASTMATFTQGALSKSCAHPRDWDVGMISAPTAARRHHEDPRPTATRQTPETPINKATRMATSSAGGKRLPRCCHRSKTHAGDRSPHFCAKSGGEDFGLPRKFGQRWQHLGNTLPPAEGVAVRAAILIGDSIVLDGWPWNGHLHGETLLPQGVLGSQQIIRNENKTNSPLFQHSG